MRTLVISDLHLGNGGPYDSFAGEAELPLLVDRAAQEPTHVFVDGDGVDFLMNEDALELQLGRAVQQAKDIVATPATAGVFAAFGRVLKGGGAVTIRLGNHDVELALPEVQAVLRGALGQPPEVAARLAFQLGDRPEILDVGGARILVTHGEHADKWNKVDYDRLKPGYRYTAGSTLVKQIINPLTNKYGLRFLNFLKPDFSGGALTALAVNPTIVKEVFQGATLDIVWQLTKRVAMAASFGEEQEDLHIDDKLGLSEAEKDALEAMLTDEGPAAFADGEEGVASKLALKIGRAGLKAYASMQRFKAGLDDAADFFKLDPNDDEWDDSKRLADKYTTSSAKIGAVIYGHTHAARWRQADGIVFANTGTWIWLMELPHADTDDAWTDFLAELRYNPRLDPKLQKVAKPRKRFTAVTLDPRPGGGATMKLVAWDGDKLATQGEAIVPAAGA